MLGLGGLWPQEPKVHNEHRCHYIYISIIVQYHEENIPRESTKRFERTVDQIKWRSQSASNLLKELLMSNTIRGLIRVRLSGKQCGEALVKINQVLGVFAAFKFILQAKKGEQLTCTKN